MAWGRKKVQAPPPSAIRQLLPLIITFIFLSITAWIGYQIWLSVVKIKAQAHKKLGDKVVFTKDGVRVKVKNVANESYVDATQSWVVKAWNLAGPNPSDNDNASKRKRNVRAKPRPANGGGDD